jgi:hypothetical protein
MNPVVVFATTFWVFPSMIFAHMFQSGIEFVQDRNISYHEVKISVHVFDLLVSILVLQLLVEPGCSSFHLTSVLSLIFSRVSCFCP